MVVNPHVELVLCLTHVLLTAHPQVIRYTTLFDLQLLSFSNISYSCLMLVLLNDEVVCMRGGGGGGGAKFTSPVGTGLETTVRVWIVKPSSDNVVLVACRLSECNH